MIIRSLLKKMLVSKGLESRLNEITKPVGVYGYDPWGIIPTSFIIGMAIFKKLYDHHFRLRPIAWNTSRSNAGPRHCNHSAQFPIDGVLFGIPIATNPEDPRGPGHGGAFFPKILFILNFIHSVRRGHRGPDQLHQNASE